MNKEVLAGVYFIPKPNTLLSMAEAVSYFEKPPTPAPELNFDFTRL